MGRWGSLQRWKWRGPRVRRVGWPALISVVSFQDEEGRFGVTDGVIRLVSVV